MNSLLVEEIQCMFKNIRIVRNQPENCSTVMNSMKLYVFGYYSTKKKTTKKHYIHTFGSYF